jgi:hypothetical protein
MQQTTTLDDTKIPRYVNLIMIWINVVVVDKA